MAWTELSIVICCITFLFLLLQGIFWVVEKMNPTKPYKGLEGDGREPKDLTTKELYKALNRGGHALREWHAVITELVIRGEKK